MNNNSQLTAFNPNNGTKNFQPKDENLIGPGIRATYGALLRSSSSQQGRQFGTAELKSSVRVREVAQKWGANNQASDLSTGSQRKLSPLHNLPANRTKVLITRFESQKGEPVAPVLPKATSSQRRPRLPNRAVAPALVQSHAPFIPSASLDDKVAQLFPQLASKARRAGSLEDKLATFLVNFNDPNRPLGNKVIQRERVLKGDLIGVEKIERVNVVEQYMSICLERIRLGENVDLNLKLLEKLCDKFNHDYTHRESSHKAEWFDSFDFRYRAGTSAKDAYPDKTYADIVDNYHVAAPVNMRYQSWTNAAGQKVGLWRCGVFTDLSNGLTNYRELKEMQKNPAQVTAKIAELRAILPHKKGRVRECIIYAIDELEKLDATVAKRGRGLEDQMLMLLWGHLRENTGKLNAMRNDQFFPIVHHCLLNENTRKIDSNSGWAHYENNAILDMAEIFDEFAGKQIIFDKEIAAPYLVGNEIHMPLIDVRQRATQLRLQTVFFNTSVQGKEDNTGIQKAINEKGLKNLELCLIAQNFSDLERREVKRSFKTLKQQLADSYTKQYKPSSLDKAERGLAAGNSNYTVAIDLGHALVVMRLPTATSCASAKDRTGVVVAAIVTTFEARQVDTMTQHSSEVRKKYNEKRARQVIHKRETAAEVVFDNNKTNIIKADPTSTIPNVPRRAQLKQGLDMARMQEVK